MFALEKEFIRMLKSEHGYIAGHGAICSYIISASYCRSTFSLILTIALAISLIIAQAIPNLIFQTIIVMISISAIPWLLISSIICMWFTYLMKNGYSEEKSYFKIFDVLRNFWIINPKVISWNDWRKIKKFSPTGYTALRNVKSCAECYASTEFISNVLKDKELKTIYLLISESQRIYGHAVLTKNGYIYDTNARRTYNREKYLKHCNAKIFKEFSFDEDDDTIWKEFKEFCNANGGIRDTDEI